MDGFGIFHYENGDKYEGEFQDNLLVGKGEMIFNKNDELYIKKKVEDHDKQLTSPPSLSILN